MEQRYINQTRHCLICWASLPSKSLPSKSIRFLQNIVSLHQQIWWNLYLSLICSWTDCLGVHFQQNKIEIVIQGYPNSMTWTLGIEPPWQSPTQCPRQAPSIDLRLEINLSIHNNSRLWFCHLAVQVSAALAKCLDKMVDTLFQCVNYFPV